MKTIFIYALGRARGAILGWGISLGLLGGWMMGLYKTMTAQQEQLTGLIKAYPPEMMAFFGDVTKMFTPGGFIHIEFFSYMPIILGIFAAMAGGSLLVGDEENGTMDLILGHPVSRRDVFFGRLGAFLTSQLAIQVIAWLGFLIFLPGSKMKITPVELALPFLSLFGLMSLFGALAVLLSMLLPSRGMASMLSGLLLVASYFITSLSKIDENLKGLAKFSPMNYYQGGEAIAGMEWKWLLSLLGFALLFSLLAWWQFERREIRVLGEGSWKLPALSFRRKQAG